MSHRRAILTASAGPNEGDTVSIDAGTCRLVGRHLSEHETVLIDRDGNRVLDGPSSAILTKHLNQRVPAVGDSHGISSDSFERGPDIIFSDSSISRAHAMIFHDTNGVGIIDLASTNGTFVNSERISSMLIIDGDTITIGNSELTVTLR